MKTLASPSSLWADFLRFVPCFRLVCVCSRTDRKCFADRREGRNAARVFHTVAQPTALFFPIVVVLSVHPRVVLPPC